MYIFVVASIDKLFDYIFQIYNGGKKVQIPVDLLSMPFFYRGGHIIPKKARFRRSSALMINDPYTIIICLDPSTDSAVGHIYYDDFHSTDVTHARLYQMKYTRNKSFSGIFSLKRLPRPGTTVILEEAANIKLPSIERVVVVNYNEAPSKVLAVSKVSGEKRPLNFFFTPSEGTAGGDGARPSLLAIRKPELAVDDSWEIQILVGHSTLDDEL